MMSKKTESIIQDHFNKENSRGRGDRSVGKEFASPEQRLEFNPQLPHEKQCHANTGKTEAAGFLGPTAQPAWPNQ